MQTSRLYYDTHQLVYQLTSDVDVRRRCEIAPLFGCKMRQQVSSRKLAESSRGYHLDIKALLRLVFRQLAFTP